MKKANGSRDRRMRNAEVSAEWGRAYRRQLLGSLVAAWGFIAVNAALQPAGARSGSAVDTVQKQRIEQLYAEDADAWSRHDIAKIASFFDPDCVLVTPDGKRMSFAERRQNLPALLARQRHSQVRITVKAVRVVDNDFVASIYFQDHHESYDRKRSAWIPVMSSSPQEDTWRSDARGNFKMVLVKFLGTRTSQFSNWQFMRRYQSTMCQAIHSGGFYTRAEPYGCRPE